MLWNVAGTSSTSATVRLDQPLRSSKEPVGTSVAERLYLVTRSSKSQWVLLQQGGSFWLQDLLRSQWASRKRGISFVPQRKKLRQEKSGDLRGPSSPIHQLRH
ncbi:hypothetical protein AVEN_48006-1 [Araneus ventricosus]|uniref:Uncharacterized protein n=1 Tax=Araneus ventricosus TaxID=182803 RepID=A0A4Y2KYV9_ARAVE|nr:hypothetical protein AVEN_39734-1 [Araneus ventricosus]GBN07508.1 hypothetical protein AVEN_48006-1 [Araneus ventricosus]